MATDRQIDRWSQRVHIYTHIYIYVKEPRGTSWEILGRILERAPPNGINPCRRTGAAIMQITYEGRSRSELSIKGCVAMMPI